MYLRVQPAPSTLVVLSGRRVSRVLRLLILIGHSARWRTTQVGVITTSAAPDEFDWDPINLGKNRRPWIRRLRRINRW